MLFNLEDRRIIPLLDKSTAQFTKVRAGGKSVKELNVDGTIACTVYRTSQY